LQCGQVKETGNLLLNVVRVEDMAVENKVVCLASVFKSIADAKKILEELSEISNKRFDGSALPLSEIVDLSSRLSDCKTNILVKLIESEKVS